MTTPIAPSDSAASASPTGTPESSPSAPSEKRADRRARPRRSAASQRAAWMAARARNAARRGLLIAAVGSMAVIATLLALVLLPREVDRAIRAQLAAVPAPRDTVPFVTALATTRLRQTTAEGLVRARQAERAAAAAVVAAVGIDSIGTEGRPRDSLALDLGTRLARARTSPLTESYRALAEARLLQNDARVRALVDSIDAVDREREAYAALGGPDARYATLTSRLSAFGNRIARIAETVLAERQPAAPTPPPAPASAAAPVAPALPPAVAPTAASDSAAVRDSARTALADSAQSLAPRPTFVRPARASDSELAAAAVAVADTVRSAERALEGVRRENAVNAARRAAVQSRSNVTVPPIAMLVAALIVGLALGYASAVAMELRRPTVGDEIEVERLAQARVIVHTGAPAVVRETRTRRRADRTLPPALDPAAEAWQQLHLTLTGLGDVARTVRIVSDQPLLGGALAINLAAAAARESRATLVVEPPSRTPVLAMLLRQPRPRGLADVQAGRAELREVVTEVPMGRDVAADVVFAGQERGAATGAKGRGDASDEELRRVAARYDLTLVVGESSPSSQLVCHDLIICGRLGVTSLEWLAQVTQAARGGQNRLRAVLLWATDLPVV